MKRLRTSWLALVVAVACGGPAVEGCTSTPPLAPEGDDDAGGFDVTVPLIDGAIDTSVADTNVIDTSVTDTNVADTNAPDTNLSAEDTGALDAGADAPDSTVVDASPDANDAASAADAADASTGADASDAAVPDTGPQFTHYVFGTNGTGIAAFGLDESTGALATISQTSVGGTAFGVSTGVAGSPNAANTLASATDPSGHYLYTANDGQHSVGAYALEHGGLMAHIDDFDAGAGIRFIVASSKFVFTANSDVGSVSRFSIGDGGVLTPLGDVGTNDGGTPIALNTVAVAVDPTGSFLFAFNQGAQTIAVFTIDGAGDLTAVDEDPVAPGQQDYAAPNSVWTGVVHPTLPVLYVVPGPGSAVIQTFAYDANGVLSTLGSTQPTGSSGDVGPDTFSIAVHPAGTYVYAGSYNDTAINVYSVAANGALTAAGSITGPGSLRGASVDSSGQYLFVAGDVGYVSTYAISGASLTDAGRSASLVTSGYAVPLAIIP